VLKALEGLEGVSKVDMTFAEGLFVVTAKESSKVTYADLKKCVGSFKLERIEISVTGELSKDDKGLWLVARGSGTKYAVANRAKKDDKDQPEDLVAKLEGWLKEGKSLATVGGVLVGEKDVFTVQAASAASVERSSRKKPVSASAETPGRFIF